MGLIRTTLKIGLVGIGIIGVGVLIAGPHRAAALFQTVRGTVDKAIDSKIDDPTALRTQLRTLEAQYPQRITDLRGDLAQLVEQRRQMDRDRAVAERVVVLADSDLAALKPLLAQAEVMRSGASPGQVVTVRFDDSTMPLDQASKRAAQIAQTRTAYASRARDAARDLSYMGQQQTRLEALLSQLETERADFQSQIWQMDRQVDSIARNDRLIELMSRRQKTMDECSRYEAGTLDQIHARMAEVRSRQEAELELLASNQHRMDYEDVARNQVDELELPAELQGLGLPSDIGAEHGAAGDAPHAEPQSDDSDEAQAATARGEVRVETVSPRPR
jgi:chromosome segregation ATPase